MSDGATPVIALAGVRVAHGARAVLDVPALAVPAGETLGVMGPNGAGKSTLLRVLGLLEAPTAGTVRFHGEVVTPAQGLAVRRRMASVFQEPLLADATVLDNAAMGLHFRGVPRAMARPRVGAWLERFGIAARADRQARTLSGGEAQRVALARALVVEPELLLLDEPFAALDQPTREALIQDLRGVLRADRVTTVLVTHHRGEALALGDRLAVLIGGRILQVGPAAQVFQAPDWPGACRRAGTAGSWWRRMATPSRWRRQGSRASRSSSRSAPRICGSRPRGPLRAPPTASRAVSPTSCPPRCTCASWWTAECRWWRSSRTGSPPF
jgi:ABC-type sulfate/molybdate transport systems ATPase subunit